MRRTFPRALGGALLLSLAAGLTGCGYLFGDKGLFRDNASDYREAVELPVMDLPPARSAESLQDLYPIPPVSAEAAAALDSDRTPRPQPLVAASADQMVRIQKLGDDAWALVAMPPGQLWPQVRGFLSAASVPIARVDARAGLIESGWLELQNQERPSRFRFRVERGVQRGNSELHVLQMFAAGADTPWPEQSDDLELEAEMLRSVAQFVANSAGTAPVSMMAEQSISAAGKVTLVDSGDVPFVRLELPFDRAWASLSRALEQSGFEITDRNRSDGVYYVIFVGDEEEGGSGWFGWLGGDDDDSHPLLDVPLLVRMSPSGNGADQTQAITLQPEAATVAAKREDVTSLLLLIKGNIN
jgi:outer membrane protein assembly factor BamC